MTYKYNDLQVYVATQIELQGQLQTPFFFIMHIGEVLGGVGTKFLMNLALHDATHQYVLANISIMMPCMQKILMYFMDVFCKIS
jgi:hypothetical protein